MLRARLVDASILICYDNEVATPATKATEVIIVRDADQAREFLVQGVWLQRAGAATARSVAQALSWCLTLADSGSALPPLGFVADVGQLALGRKKQSRARTEAWSLPGWSDGLGRGYEDLVLGRLFADPLFERASDALRRIEPAKQAVGLAYLIRQMTARLTAGGVEFSPGIIRGLLHDKPEDVLRRGWESLQRDGPMALLRDLYRDLIAGSRRAADLLAIEDVIALEHKTALLSMSEYVAHRQVLQAAGLLAEGLTNVRPRSLPGRPDVATRLHDENAYPVGGFSSISNRGTMESLLHSQLALMETDPAQRPDLFDVKFLRDELYYYSRDENQFLRRRRTFLFLLDADLSQQRFKDASLPFQRLVLVLGMLLAAQRQLTLWLAEEAIQFEFLFVESKPTAALEEERKLLELIYREEIAAKRVTVTTIGRSDMVAICRDRAAQSRCQGLAISAQSQDLDLIDIEMLVMQVDGPAPVCDLLIEGDESREPLERWRETLRQVLRQWV